MLVCVRDTILHHQNSHQGHNIRVLLNEKHGMCVGWQQGAHGEVYCLGKQGSPGTAVCKGTCQRGVGGRVSKLAMLAFATFQSGESGKSHKSSKSGHVL
jgi:hypothetical protein